MSGGRAPNRPNMFQRFAGKGGIGKARALCDCVAEDLESLSFQKDDEIIVLLRVANTEDTFLGSLNGKLGIFAGSDVKFLGPLKTPVKRPRIPTPLGLYSPSMQSSSYDSDASSNRFPQTPGSDGAFPPDSPKWLFQQSPYLNERQRSLSASISAGSVTDAESSPSLYKDFQRSRFQSVPDVLPHASIGPWISAVTQSMNAIGPNPSTLPGGFPPSSVPQISSNVNPSSPRDAYSHSQPPFSSSLSGSSRVPAGGNAPVDSPMLQPGPGQALASRLTSFPKPPAALHASALHMPKPRIATSHRPSFLKHSVTSTALGASPLRGQGFGERVLVEDDDDIPPTGADIPLPEPTLPKKRLSKITINKPYSPRPRSARDSGFLGSPPPRSPLSPISPNHPTMWSPSPRPVPILSASPNSTSPVAQSSRRQHIHRERLTSLTRRPRPSSRSGSGSSSCAEPENLPPLFPFSYAPNHPSSVVVREASLMRASPSPAAPIDDFLDHIRVDARPPSSAQASSGSRGRHCISSPSQDATSGYSSDAGPDVYGNMVGTIDPVTASRRDAWALPPLVPQRISYLACEPIPEEGGESLMQVDGAGSRLKMSLTVNPLKYDFEQAASRRRRDVKMYSSSESSSNRLSKSDGESSWLASN